MSYMGDVVLCVGGRLFRENSSLLASRSEFFAGLLNGNWEVGENGSVFVDRNPDAFEAVLQLMRDPKHDFPVELWGHELDFYGVPLPLYRRPLGTHFIDQIEPCSETTQQITEKNSFPPSHNSKSPGGDECAQPTQMEQLLELVLRGSPEEERQDAYLERWFWLDPDVESQERLPKRKQVWLLDPDRCHEVREVELALELSLPESLANAGRLELMENGILAEAVGIIELNLGGIPIWSCSGGSLMRYELLRGISSMDELADYRRESLLAKRMFRRDSEGNLLRSFRFRLPLWPWYAGEEERTKGHSADESNFPHLRYHPYAAKWHKWRFYRTECSQDSAKGPMPLWKLERVRLRVLGRTYARPVLPKRESDLRREFTTFVWQTQSLSPLATNPVLDGNYHKEFIVFRLHHQDMSCLPKDKFVFQLLVNGKPTSVSRVALYHTDSSDSERVELYSGSEFELLEDMAGRGWWPTSPVYCACIGELRMSLASLSNCKWHQDHVNFCVVPRNEMPENASVTLEVDVCLRTIMRYCSGICGQIYCA